MTRPPRREAPLAAEAESPLVTGPGIYADVKAERYHADRLLPVPTLSASIGKALVKQSPAHAMASHPRLARYPIREDKTTFDIGTAAHAMLLHEDRALYIHDGDSWRGHAADLRDEAYAAGKTPLLAEQFERVQLMVELCRAQLADHEAQGAFEGGRAEHTVIWAAGGGAYCRCRPDWMPDTLRPGSIIYDYKTTAASAHPDAWGARTLWNIGADFSAAFYLLGLKAVTGLDLRYRFVVQEQKPPHALCVVEIQPDGLMVARRDVSRAIEMWRQCLRSDLWPGYPTRVCYVEMPAWEEVRRLAREEREPVTPDMIEAALEWQRPLEGVP